MKPDYFEIEPSRLADSPFQPRKHYAAESLQELADNIKQVGILEPIIARPITQVGIDTQEGADLEIIVGHRRRRAGEMAGRETVPVIIRSMTDAEVRIAQISENLQRQDVTAIEEGEALRASVDSGDHTAQALAKALGKSVAYVYARMKLAELTGEASDLVADGTVPAEVGLLISRLPAIMHSVALEHVAPFSFQEEDGPRVRKCHSLRNARKVLAQNNLLPSIAAALFNTADHQLVEGALACTLCPNNSTNISGEETGRCYDRTCYILKTKAELQQKLQALKDAGWTTSNRMPYDGTWKTIELVQDRIDLKRLEHPSIVALQRATIGIGHDGLPKLFRYVIESEFENWWNLNIWRPAATADTPSTAAPATGVRGTVQAPALDQDDGPAPTVATPRDRSMEEPITFHGSNADRILGDAYLDLEEAVVDGILGGAHDMRTEKELLYVTAALLNPLSEHVQMKLIGALPGSTPAETLAKLRIMSPARLGAIALSAALMSMHEWAETGPAGDDLPMAILDDLALRYAPGYEEDSSRADGAEEQDQSGLSAEDDDQDDAPLTGVEKVFVDAGLKARPSKPAIKYRDPDTGASWTGRGLKPRWLSFALESGRTLNDFEVAR